MTKQELIEELAAIEHERWADWQRYLHSRGVRDPQTGKLVIDADWVWRWERQIDTFYADLSEQEKASDREQVARYWPVIVAFVADWLEHDGREYLAAAWREAMQ